VFTESRQGDPSTISTGLLSGVRRHDGEAWRRLVKLYGPLVYRWCRESGLHPHNAEDVVQEVFCAILGGISTFRREKSGDTFRGWLRTVTINKVRDAARRLGHQPLVPGGIESADLLAAVPDPPSSRESSVANDLGLLARALDSIRGDFSATTWQAFQRAALQGHSAREIGDDLSLTPQAVRQAKHRVLVRLREELDPDH
jgi:RNA polymerase sigma-70 factor (ECF subfamily)